MIKTSFSTEEVCWRPKPVFKPSDVSWKPKSRERRLTSDTAMSVYSIFYSIFRTRRKREKVFFAFLAFSVIALFIRIISERPEPSSAKKTSHFPQNSENVDTSGQSCVHPVLNPNDPSVRQFFKKIPKLQCNQEENWVYVKNGTFSYTPSMRTKYGNFSCTYVPILRGPNDNIVIDGNAIENIMDQTPLQTDFFRVTCINKDGIRYHNVHSGIAVNNDLHYRAEKTPLPTNALGLSVIMFGLDSVSHMTWKRMLPKTYDYFAQLGGMVLEGYNIVGDGTPQALLPILTGKTEWELPEARRSHANAKPVDDHPWVWKDFKRAGYVTQWGEDMTNIGTFNYRMLGFQNPPVDHYMRPFFLEAEKVYRFNKDYCLGSQTRQQNFINWLKQLLLMYGENRKFSFMFHSECSHGDNNLVQHLDDDLVDFLKFMATSGHMNHSILIFMSDHGARFQNIRETVQGKLEERMPHFGFLFPRWFADKYPEAYANFKTNTRRLTTPFDIHETFMHLLNFTDFSTPDLKSRAFSLFREVPKNRSCRDADIEPHWCACLVWEKVSTNDERVKNAALETLKVMNGLTSELRSDCRILQLVNVTNALRLRANQQVLKFKRSSDVDGRYADLSDQMAEKEYLIQVTFRVTPGDGLFEATVKHNVALATYAVNEKEISRINKYGLAPSCIASRHPALRPYCYCAKQA